MGTGEKPPKLFGELEGTSAVENMNSVSYPNGFPPAKKVLNPKKVVRPKVVWTIQEVVEGLLNNEFDDEIIATALACLRQLERANQKIKEQQDTIFQLSHAPVEYKTTITNTTSPSYINVSVHSLRSMFDKNEDFKEEKELYQRLYEKEEDKVKEAQHLAKVQMERANKAEEDCRNLINAINTELECHICARYVEGGTCTRHEKAWNDDSVDCFVYKGYGSVDERIKTLTETVNKIKSCFTCGYSGWDKNGCGKMCKKHNYMLDSEYRHKCDYWILKDGV